jgi:hypothetical protein
MTGACRGQKMAMELNGTSPLELKYRQLWVKPEPSEIAATASQSLGHIPSPWAFQARSHFVALTILKLSLPTCFPCPGAICLHHYLSSDLFLFVVIQWPKAFRTIMIYSNVPLILSFYLIVLINFCGSQNEPSPHVYHWTMTSEHSIHPCWGSFCLFFNFLHSPGWLGTHNPSA